MFFLHFKYSNFRFYPKKSNLPQVHTRSTWDPDKGYKRTENEWSYPYRAYASGSPFSLSVYLKVNKIDIDYTCGGPIQGFKIYFLPPNEKLSSMHSFFYLPFGKASQFSVKPELTFTSDSVKTYSPDERQCFLNSERNLRFFNFYTKINCEEECLSNFTAKLCGCVHFYMPRKGIIQRLSTNTKC